MGCRSSGNTTKGKFKRTAGEKGGKAKVPKGFANSTRTGQRILVLKHKWLSLIVGGGKTMEVRGSRLRSGHCLLGCGGKIYASASLGDAVQIKTVRQWQELRGQHLVENKKLPYGKTWGLSITGVRPFKHPIEYKHPRGAITIVKLRK